MAKRINNTGLSRRQFLNRLTALGGAAALAAFLEGCSTPDINQSIIFDPTPLPETPTSAPQFTPTTAASPGPLKPAETNPSPTATPTTNSTEALARVAFVKTTDRAEGVRKAIDLLGINPVAGKRVFLKPNFNSADPTPGSTHLDVLTSLIAALNGMGAKAILVGDRSGMGNTRQVMEQIGVFRLAEELGFEALVLDELPAEDWVMIQPEGSHWETGFPFARPAFEAEALVQTCCLKTHRYGGHFTLSLKNSVGMVAKRHPQGSHEFMQELHNSAYQRRMIAEINAAYTPALIVLDGIEAFISGGPDVGEKVPSGVILSGTDRIAIDAVGVALLRYFGCKSEAARGKIFEQEQIARAVELELGIGSPQQVEFLTGDPESDAYSQKIKEILLAG